MSAFWIREPWEMMSNRAMDGIPYVCVGSAGAPWKFPGTVTGYSTFWTVFGCTWVNIKKNKVTVSFVKTDDILSKGIVLHRFDIWN